MQDAYIASLVQVLDETGVTDEAINLSVEAGSILVTANIEYTTQPPALLARQLLDELSPGTTHPLAIAAGEALGSTEVTAIPTVEETAPATVTLKSADETSPPSSSPMRSPPFSTPPPDISSPPPPVVPSASETLEVNQSEAIEGFNIDLDIEKGGDGDPLPGYAIALIVVFGLLLLVCVVCYFCRRSNGKQHTVLKDDTVVRSTAVNLQVDQPPTSTTRAGAPAVDFALIESKISRLDLETNDPEADHKAVKARLREYEKAFMRANDGRLPRTRYDWGDMWPEYERYVNLRRMVVNAPGAASSAPGAASSDADRAPAALASLAELSEIGGGFSGISREVSEI